MTKEERFGIWHYGVAVDEDDEWGVVEVYPNPKGFGWCWADVHGGTKEELINELEAMLLAVKEGTVFEIKGGNLEIPAAQLTKEERK